MVSRRSGPESLAALVEAFHRQPGLSRLRTVLVAAARAGKRTEVRAHLIERLEADAACDPRCLYRLYLEDGQDLRAAQTARCLGDPGSLIEVAEATVSRFRILALQLYLEAADRLARQGRRPAYARAAAVLCRLREATAGDEGAWHVLIRGFAVQQRWRRGLGQEMIRAGLDPADLPFSAAGP